jgi:hypothetical protein
MAIGTQHDFFEALQSIATTIGIGVGGWWAYTQFQKNREPQPKADLVHVVVHRRMPTGHLWVRVELRLSNKGKVLLAPSAGETRIYRVLPLGDKLQAKLDKGEGLLREGSTEFDWELLEQPRNVWPGIEIEPGETDGVSYDFLLEPKVQTILLYSHVTHERRNDGKDFGWSCHTVYELIDNSNKSIQGGSCEGP